ncbi:MAG: single-stranded-DNA-specific exonuclease RecJ [Clostridia bacterium]|nr:single-stranded-DNA-specific exonuclease RecJ [Clostridia bacterium]
MAKQNNQKEKRWIVKSEHSPIPSSAVKEIADGLGINSTVASLLYSRGFCDVAKAKDFIYMESELLCDPFLMADMERGVERLRRAVDSGEKITVYGDYDVDGVTAVCTLYLYLCSLGCKVDYYIPNRVGEGYGVSQSAIDTLAKEGTSLIITVDTGITANEEVEYAKGVGVDFLITDHHECRSTLPEASAVINPHRPDCPYPFKELAGVGVVFKFISAYEERIYGTSKLEAARKLFESYSDLVAIGTIADVMPIREENRIIVKHGLRQIQNTSRPGLHALIEVASSRGDSHRYQYWGFDIPKITSSYIGYTLAPRINAAGRIHCASVAVELFLEEELERAYSIAEDLCRMNKERQAEENKIMQEAYAKIEAQGLLKDSVIVLDADDWHHGVIGIVSSRITEKYCRPSILVSFEGNGDGEPSPEDVGKGSGRSIKGMNLVDALMNCSDCLVKFGGHELAAGLSVKRCELENFRRRINEYARENLTEEDMIPTAEADLAVDFSEVNLALAKSLRMLEPYGVGNPVPHFVLYGVTVYEMTGVSDSKHTRLSVGCGAGSVTAMYFGHSPSSLGVYVGDRVDLLFNLDINEWGGRESVQLIVRDIRIAKSEEERISRERERFDEIWGGAPFTESENILPTRDDFAAVYKLIAASIRTGVNTLSHRDIISRLSSSGNAMTYGRLKIIILVLKELNLVGITDLSEELYKFSIHYTASKTRLDKSAILRKLRSQLKRGTA